MTQTKPAQRSDAATDCYEHRRLTARDDHRGTKMSLEDQRSAEAARFSASPDQRAFCDRFANAQFRRGPSLPSMLKMPA
jgi:hypothetical protein